MASVAEANKLAKWLCPSLTSSNKGVPSLVVVVVSVVVVVVVLVVVVEEAAGAGGAAAGGGAAVAAAAGGSCSGRLAVELAVELPPCVEGEKLTEARRLNRVDFRADFKGSCEKAVKSAVWYWEGVG